MYYPLVRTNLNTEFFFFATRLAVVIDNRSDTWFEC